MSILITSINRRELDDNLRSTGISRDEEAELDSRFVMLGDECIEDDTGRHIKELDTSETVDGDLLGLVFWNWVPDVNAESTGVGYEGTHNKIINYAAASIPPFGRTIGVESGSDDEGDYVAFVISYKDLCEMLEPEVSA